MSKHHKKGDERDPIADYKEWSDHRYDPGYFTGGRLSPGLRRLQASLSKRDKRILLVLIVAGLVVAIGAQIWVWIR